MRETFGKVENQNSSKCGRPSLYTEREKRIIVRKSLTHPQKSLRDLAKDKDINHKGATSSTLHNLFKTAKILMRVLPKRCDDLPRKILSKRNNFARNHSSWDKFDWSLVIFSDEADLFPTKPGKRYIRVRESQAKIKPPPPSKILDRKITVKIFGIISSLGVGPLIRYTGSMDRKKYLGFLKRYLLQNYPFLEHTIEEEREDEPPWPAWIYMDDNARPHRAKIVTNWKKDNCISSLDIPARSPDLNLMENVWSVLQDKLFEIKDRLVTKEDTWRNALEFWNSLEMSYINKLYESMPNRMQEVIKNVGGPIDY